MGPGLRLKVAWPQPDLQSMRTVKQHQPSRQMAQYNKEAHILLYTERIKPSWHWRVYHRLPYVRVCRCCCD